MILCLDVGNSQIHGGIFAKEILKLQFRRTTRHGSTSDEFGVFLRNVLRENSLDPESVTQIAICTVVPEVLHSLKNACKKYFNINPFVLQAGVRTGLKIKYRNPLEVGADRIANAIAATHLYARDNLLVVDFGTATTFCAINRDKEYLGGVILPGLRISMSALESSTSKLPAVEIVVPENQLGRSTVESIQSGLFFGCLGAVKEVQERIIAEAFSGIRPKIIVTGGFASLFSEAIQKGIIDSHLFDMEIPDLVLKGLFLALKMNT
ncbi:MAG: type III pantothenate kinase [Bdellovibrionales bacterium]|nr:type III pantothenate kinase [Bdellovibrionales bacterium]